MTISLPHGIMVTATTRADEDKKLNAAIVELQHLAFANPTRGGILVTRLGSGQFDVQLSAEVPYGLTWNRCSSRHERASRT